MKHSSVKDRALYDQTVMPGIHPDGAVNVPSIRAALGSARFVATLTSPSG